jgi:hypothetical protein
LAKCVSQADDEVKVRFTETHFLFFFFRNFNEYLAFFSVFFIYLHHLKANCLLFRAIQNNVQQFTGIQSNSKRFNCKKHNLNKALQKNQDTPVEKSIIKNPSNSK